MIKETKSLIQSWENISRKGKDPFEIDVNKEMMTLTFKIIGESLFGKLLGEKSSVIQKSLGKATDITIKRIMTGVSRPLSFRHQTT